MAASDYMTITDVAVNNSEGSVTLGTRMSRFWVYVPTTASELRHTASGTGFGLPAGVISGPFGNKNLRGQTIYLYSTGNITINVLEELGEDSYD